MPTNLSHYKCEIKLQNRHISRCLDLVNPSVGVAHSQNYPRCVCGHNRNLAIRIRGSRRNTKNAGLNLQNLPHAIFELATVAGTRRQLTECHLDNLMLGQMPPKQNRVLVICCRLLLATNGNNCCQTEYQCELFHSVLDQPRSWLPHAVPPVWLHGADFISVVHILQSLSRRALATAKKTGRNLIPANVFHFKCETKQHGHGHTFGVKINSSPPV